MRMTQLPFQPLQAGYRDGMIKAEAITTTPSQIHNFVLFYDKIR